MGDKMRPKNDKRKKKRRERKKGHGTCVSVTVSH